MFIEVRVELIKRPKCKHGRRRKEVLTKTKTTYVCRCDVCDKVFERKNSSATRNKLTHYCSKQCCNVAKKRGGKIFEKQRSIMLEKYGVENALIRPDVLKSNLEKSHSAIAQQRRSISIKNWHKNRPIDWINPGNTPEASLKRHETMKKNGTYNRSNVEDKCFEFLCKEFGVNNIERSVIINERWPIDFYIRSIDAYVQLDGVYWHGLNRCIDEIRASQSKRDKQILKHRETDMEQNSWFVTKGLKLVRVTDVEFKKTPDVLLKKLTCV